MNCEAYLNAVDGHADSVSVAGRESHLPQSGNTAVVQSPRQSELLPTFAFVCEKKSEEKQAKRTRKSGEYLHRTAVTGFVTRWANCACAVQVGG